MDEIDLAQEREDELRQKALLEQAERAEKQKPTLMVGLCNNCERELEGTRRFCNADCRDDWEHRRRAYLRAYGSNP